MHQAELLLLRDFLLGQLGTEEAERVLRIASQITSGIGLQMV